MDLALYYAMRLFFAPSLSDPSTLDMVGHGCLLAALMLSVCAMMDRE